MTPWKPSTEQPKRATVAIIATMPPEFDSFALLADLYVGSIQKTEFKAR